MSTRFVILTLSFDKTRKNVSPVPTRLLDLKEIESFISSFAERSIRGMEQAMVMKRNRTSIRRTFESFSKLLLPKEYQIFYDAHTITYG